MSSKIHTEMTSDGKQLMKTLQDSQREIEKLTNENRKLRDESKKQPRKRRTVL
jgi:FtsZ-binding cell division protein ZapB